MHEYRQVRRPMRLTFDFAYQNPTKPLLTTLLEVTRIVGRGKVTQIYIKLLKPVSLNYFLFRLCWKLLQILNKFDGNLIVLTLVIPLPILRKLMQIELGLHPDRQTVRPPRDCLITEIPPLHQGNHAVHNNRSTAPTLAVVLVIWFRCCAFAL